MMKMVACALVGGITLWLRMRGIRTGRRRLAETQWRPTRFGILFDDSGFTVNGIRSHSTDEVQMRWMDVHRVTSYQHDLWCDEIVCLFFARHDEAGIEVNEEMAGWEPFCKAWPKFLAGAVPVPKLLGEIPTSPASAEVYARLAD